VIALVQGFGPFSDHDPNPSELLVRALGERGRPGTDLVTEVLPTSRATVVERIPALMAQHRPDVWLGVGLAAGRPSLSVETVGINLAHWTEAEPDADGEVVDRQPISEGGPAAHLTTLPVEEILDAWRVAGIPGYQSLTAGSYLCNMSLYTAAQAAEELDHRCLVGFLHVPLLPEHVTDPARQPSMSMDLQAAGLDAVLSACRGATEGSGPYLRRTA
jgi:pyroglutamyl-peptidase